MHEKKEKESGELCGKDLPYLSTYQNIGCRDLKEKKESKACRILESGW